MHDRLGPRQSSQQQHAAPVKPVQPDHSDRSQQRPAQSHPPKQVYCINQKEDEVQPMQVDFGETAAEDVVKVGNVNVVLKDVGKQPMVFGKSAKTNPRSLCWLMVMKPAVTPRRTSTINLSGARRV